MRTKNNATKAVTHKKRTSKVASKHTKALVTASPVATVALLQAAFAAGQAAVESFYSNRSREALQPGNPARAPDLDTMYRTLQELGAEDAKGHMAQARSLLEGATSEERKLFSDVIALDDSKVDAPLANTTPDEDQKSFEEMLGALLGIGADEMDERSIDETSDDVDDGPSAAFPC